MQKYSWHIPGLFLSCLILATDGGAGEAIEPMAALHALEFGNADDTMRVELAPNYSEDLGPSLKAAAGSYLGEDAALGLIVEYGLNKREYLANVGAQLSEELSLVGTIGLLEERYEFVAGEGKDTVRQMEYGASLRGSYEFGPLNGFALNGYLANADADSRNVESGKLYGIELTTSADLTSSTNVNIGAGYEWLAWDDGSHDDSLAFSAILNQRIGDVLSVTASTKLGASEFLYGGGLALDLGRDGGNTNRVGLNYSFIEGRNGIEDDQRIELGWSIGFGAGRGSDVTEASSDLAAHTIRPVADAVLAQPRHDLLGQVMKRPSYLPTLVIARAAAGGLKLCSAVGIQVEGYLSHTPNAFDFDFAVDGSGQILGILLHVIGGVGSFPATASLAGVSLARLDTNYAFMGPNETVITEGDFYPFIIGQVTCLLQAHRQPI